MFGASHVIERRGGSSTALAVAIVAIALLGITAVGWAAWSNHRSETAGANRAALRHAIKVARHNEDQTQRADAARVATEAKFAKIETYYQTLEGQYATVVNDARTAAETVRKLDASRATLQSDLDAVTGTNAELRRQIAELKQQVGVCYPDSPIRWKADSSE